MFEQSLRAQTEVVMLGLPAGDLRAWRLCGCL